MKSPFESRIACTFMSLVCASFIYTDITEHDKINILNLIYFFGFTFLAFYNQKKVVANNQEKYTPRVNLMKKTSIDDLTEEKQLSLTKLFSEGK